MTHRTEATSLGICAISLVKEYPIEVKDLTQWGHWLLSLNKRDHELLQQTREFRDFIETACRLEKTHQSIQEDWIAVNNVRKGKQSSRLPPKKAYLQYTLSDEAVLCVLDYLPSYSLAKTAATCTRLRNLAYRNARTRCKEMEQERQLTNVMHLLCAKEQIEGLYWGSHLNPFARKNDVLPSVRIPMLLPGRRVLVTGASDLEFNGVYCCTGCNGNGFVFTKPRHRLNDFSRRGRHSDQIDEIRHTTRRLNCVFARRFSGQDLFWYLSKESYQKGEGIIETFLFWAPLPTTGSTTPDLFWYPSQTSTLRQRDQQTWQCLETTNHLEPPIVEISV